MTANDNELDAEEITLPAGGDVVAQIRAHAAKVRRGEVVAGEDLEIWTPDADEAQIEAEPEIWTPDADEAEIEAEPELAEQVVEEVPVEEVRVESLLEVPAAVVDDHAAELPPVRDLRRSATSVGGGVSLIEGLSPPDTSAEFWTSDRPFRASGIDAKPRRQMGAARMWIWLVLATLLIIAASVGIALVVATTGSTL